MIINQKDLLIANPVDPMINHKVRNPGAMASYGLAEVGYDIRIQQDLHYKWNEGNPVIEWSDPVTGESGTKEGHFILASSVEKFTVPPYLAGIVHDKSTWGRLGVAVQNTVIEPGWAGYLTMEIDFQDRNEVHIPSGSGIAQIIFHSISNPISYDGKYQDQEQKPVEAIKG